MSDLVTLDDTVVPSGDVVARRIEGELVLVPLASGMGDSDDQLFSMNKTGEAIWDRLDGRHTLRAVAAELADLYDDPDGEIEVDVLGLIGELVKRRMVVVRQD